MKISDKGIQFIKDHEGLRLEAYQDSAGVWTIGYGHTDGVKPGQVISEAMAEQYLISDLAIFEAAVNRRVFLSDQPKFDALVSFAFNVGAHAFEKSTLSRLVDLNPENPAIRDEFKKWKWVTFYTVENGVQKKSKKIVPGLLERRCDEADLYFNKL